MKHRAVMLFITAILFLGLACGTFGGEEPLEQAATLTKISTPTLAPTATERPAETRASEAPSAEPTLLPTVSSQASVESTVPPESGQSGGSENGGNAGTSPTTTCPVEGLNLLLNPSFEGQYTPYGAFVELNHAPSWIPWWKDGENNQRPEFKPAESALAPNRIHSGERAQQYFKSFGMFKAGVQQTALGVPVGSRVQASAHGQAWSCQDSSLCGDGSSFNPANMLMRVGIDPSGGTDPFSNSIVWSAYFNPLDQWQVACVDATTEAENVTVFLWASPDGPRQNQDIYWDDASLVLLP